MAVVQTRSVSRPAVRHVVLVVLVVSVVSGDTRYVTHILLHSTVQVTYTYITYTYLWS